MKKLYFLIMFLLTPVILLSQDFKVDVKNSNIEWVGKKITGSHNGTIALKNGFITIDENDNITNGKFTLNMESILCADLTGAKKGYLEEHLKDEDFFNTSKYPTATFEVKKSNKNTIIGILTIKEISQEMEFEYTKINTHEYKADIIIDRTLFDITYKSKSAFPIKYADNFIYDDFSISLNPIIFQQ